MPGSTLDFPLGPFTKYSVSVLRPTISRYFKFTKPLEGKTLPVEQDSPCIKTQICEKRLFVDK
jgi:hypothetical protein